MNENQSQYTVCFEGKEECVKQGFDAINDNLILGGALFLNRQSPIEFYTDDLLLSLIAKSNGLIVKGSKELINNEVDYKGYKEVRLADSEMAEFYNNLSTNIFSCNINEYLVIYNTDLEIVDKRKWTGEKYIPITYKSTPTDFMEKVTPINLQQELAFDMLQDRCITVKVLTGKFGSGKDYIMIANALHLVKTNKFNKILWLRNNIEVKNTKPIGFLPGTLKDKVIDYAAPLYDHCGGKEGLDKLIAEGVVELGHLGFSRGRDLKNMIILCSEFEQNTKEHLQLLISRISSGSELWINGDCKQIDEQVFEYNNGLKAAINRLKNQKRFGFVKLEKVERSETAMLADLLD